MPEPAADPLWIRYIDWCSARITRSIINMSPDEIWERAERSRQTAPPGPDAPGSSYLDLVRSLTLALFDELSFPSYDDWLRLYRSDPEPFEREILGFAAAENNHTGPAHR